MDDSTNPLVPPVPTDPAAPSTLPTESPPPLAPAGSAPVSEPAWHAPNLPSDLPAEPTPPAEPGPVIPEPEPEPILPPETPPTFNAGFVPPEPPPEKPETVMDPTLVAPPKKGGGIGKAVVLGIITLLVVGSGVLGYNLLQQGGLPFNIGKKAAEGDTCTYGESCGSGKRCCTGTIQGGSCKYNPGVNPNCTGCSQCVTGDCGCGCPDSCKGGQEPTQPPSTQKCPDGGHQECGNLNKCNIQGGCDPACCLTDSDCPTGQVCDIPNGNCDKKKSCNDKGGGHHKDCVGPKCVEVAGAGTDNCDSDAKCQGTQPPGTCSGATQCPGGTKDCPSGKMCRQTGNSSCPNTCQDPISGHPPGWCNNTSECASWEVCQNNGCHSTAGCTNDGECASGMKCINNTCTGGTGNVECNADVNGVSIKNNTSGAITVTFEWFSKKCTSSNCMCGGAPTTETQTIAAGAALNRGISGSGCSWQSDLKVTSGPPIAMGCNTAHAGCISGCGGTTPTGTLAACASVELLDVTPSLNTTTKVQTITWTVGKRMEIRVHINGTVEDAAIKILKDGAKVYEKNRESDATPDRGPIWGTIYNITEPGSYEVRAFVKVNGQWK